MDNNNILDLKSDALSLIFNCLIFDRCEFYMFGRLLIAWVTKRSAYRIKDVLERLDWDSLYHFHRHDFEVTRDQFHGFIRFAVRFHVEQAMFYNSVQKLFLNVNVHHNISVLETLSGNHLPSRFAYFLFKAIHIPFGLNQAADEMFHFLNISSVRSKVLQQIDLLQDMYFYLFERDYLLPSKKFCPNARNPEPFDLSEGRPMSEELWLSLCEKTVEENFRDERNPYGKILNMQHIWGSECHHCRLQLLVYKILLNSVS